MMKNFTPEYINQLSRQIPDSKLWIESGNPQPIHTVYGGAQLFSENTFSRIQQIAKKAFSVYAPNPETLAQIFPQTGVLDFPVQLLYDSIEKKLATSCTEDYRIDFEDGYGYRPDEEEDQHAIASAKAAAMCILNNTAPKFFGFRIKPFTPAAIQRSLQTLGLFLYQLAESLDGAKPDGFLVTLPKVETIQQVQLFNNALDTICADLQWTANEVRTELMIETPQAIVNEHGTVTLPTLIDTAGPRLFALHAGLYDFTGAMDIAATDQMYKHPYADILRFFLVAAGKNAGIHISDGATSYLPVERHKTASTQEQLAENKRIIWKAWRLHFDNTLHSLTMGIVQGWDLHPAQIPARIAALYYYFYKDKAKLFSRFIHFIASAAQATSRHGTFDDAATGQGMLNFLLKGYECGAFTGKDFTDAGLSTSAIVSRSFPTICNDFLMNKEK